MYCSKQKTFSVLFLLVACVIYTTRAYEFLREKSFLHIQQDSTPKFVIFYRGSNLELHKTVLDVFENAAEKASILYPNFVFNICDGDSAVNEKEIKDAGFDNGVYIFTTTPTQGIQRYYHDFDESVILRHIEYMHYPPENDQVVSINSQQQLSQLLASNTKPLFVKFFEEWCTHCKALKAPFAVASKVLSNVIFAEVQCSSTTQTKDICSKYGVTSFPTLKLLKSDGKVEKFDSPGRTVLGFEAFFVANGATDTSRPSRRLTETEVGEENEVEDDEGEGDKDVISSPSPAHPTFRPDHGAQEALETRVRNLEEVIEALLDRIESLEKR